MPYFDSLKTIRECAGIRTSTLAKKAEVDRSTITRIEKHHNSTSETLHSVVNALNDLYYTLNGENSIDYQKVITEESEFGGNK